LFCHNTSQVEDEPYPKLLSEKGGRGFPYVAFLDAEGEVITPQGYDKLTVKGFHETLAKVNDFIRLEKLAQDGDKSAETPLFIAKVKLGRFNFAEASKQRKKLPSESVAQKKEIDSLLFDLHLDAILGKLNRRDPDSFGTVKDELLALKKGKVTKEQAERIEEHLIGLEVNQVLGKIDRRDPGTMDAAVESLLAMRKAGRVPKSGGAAGNFWIILMNHAFKEKNAELAEEAFNAIKKAYGKNIRKAWVDTTQERLAKLKEEAKDNDEAKDKDKDK